MSISPINRLVSFFRGEDVPPAPAVSQSMAVAAVEKLVRPPSSKPIPIPGFSNHSLKTRDQNSADDIGNILGTLSFEDKRYNEQLVTLTCKVKKRLKTEFHKLDGQEIEKIADLVITHSSLSSRKGMMIVKKDPSVPRTIHIDYDKKMAVICLKTKQDLPQYRTKNLRTTRAILIRWKNEDAHNPLSTTTFRVTKIFQHVSLDTLPKHEALSLKPLEERTDEEARWFFPEYFGSYAYLKGEKVKNCFLTAGYDMSVLEAVENYSYTFRHVVVFAQTLLGKLQVLHNSDIEHGDINLHKIFIIDKDEVALTGYECAKEGNGKADLHALGVVLEELLAIVLQFQKPDKYGYFLVDLIARLKRANPPSATEALAYFKPMV